MNETTNAEKPTEIADPVEGLVSRQFNLTECLSFDPFQGDFGYGDERELENKIVTARKHHECHYCNGNIIPGDKYWLKKEIADGELRTYRWCTDCCIGMILTMNGHT